MTATDYAKAAGIAALVLSLDLLFAIVVVLIWSIFIEPGHPRAYYETAGVPLARWSTRIFGTALIGAAAWLCARRRPERNAVAFAIALTIGYAVLDGATVAFQGFFTLSIAITMLLKLLGALAGALLAVRGAVSRRQPS